jgi:O-antigen ligase
MAFVMPVFVRVIPLFIGFFALFNLLDGFVNKTFRFPAPLIFIVGILFYIIHVISVFYSDDFDTAWFDISVKLSFLVFPLVFLFQNPILLTQKKKILMSFVYGSIVSSIIMLVLAFLKYEELGSAAFYYVELALFHPSYMAMYFVFSIIIMVDLIEKSDKSIWRNWLYLLAILFLVFMISVLQSKAGILSGILIALFYLAVSVWKKRKKLLMLGALLLIVSTGLIFIQQSNRLVSMVESVEKASEDQKTEDSTGLRISIWKITLQELKEHWLMGVGSGDIKPVLKSKYEETGLNKAFVQNLNVHNQYLETFLGQGIFGFILLLTLLVLGLREAYLRQDVLSAAFIVLVAFSLFPESMFNSQMGVIFISFFYYFLFIYREKTLVSESKNMENQKE